MSLTQIIRYVRVEIITGKHLRDAFCEQTKREEGWQRIQRALRIARRLDIDRRCLPNY